MYRNVKMTLFIFPKTKSAAIISSNITNANLGEGQKAEEMKAKNEYSMFDKTQTTFLSYLTSQVYSYPFNQIFAIYDNFRKKT